MTQKPLAESARIKDWKVPLYLQEAFPSYSLQITPYAIRAPFYAHRCTLHIVTDDGIETTTSLSQHIIIDAERDARLKELVFERVRKAVARQRGTE